MTALVAVICGVVGTVVGAFLNAVIDRVPARQPVFAGGGAATVLRPPSSRRDVLVVAGTVVLFVAAALRFGPDWALPAFCVFFAALLAVAVIDLDHFIVPNRVVYPTIAASVPLLLAAAALTGDWFRVRTAAVGGIGGFVVLFVIHFIQPRGMGFGDVRLAGVIGLHLGWLGYRHVFLGLFLGFLLGALTGVGLMATKVRGRKDPVPFAPFLASGAVLAVLAGRGLITWWTGG